MAYTKTPWTDDSAPFITAVNLNKIEDGIEKGANHADAPHAPSDADNTANNETSHADVLVTGDVGVNVQAYSAILQSTTASFTTTLEGKLDDIEAQAQVNTVHIDTVNTYTKAQRGVITTLTYGSIVTPDFSYQRFKCMLVGNVTIANPTNVVAGQGGMIYLEQDVTGGYTTAWGSNFIAPDTTNEDAGANKVNVYAYEVYSPTQIVVNHIRAF